jgi:hypothetical protein
MLQEPLANPFFQQDLVWVMETRRGKDEEKPMKVTIAYISCMKMEITLMYHVFSFERTRMLINQG